MNSNFLTILISKKVHETIFFKKLIVTQMINKFPVNYGTRGLITVS